MAPKKSERSSGGSVPVHQRCIGWIRDLVLADSGPTEAPPILWDTTVTPLTATTQNVPNDSETVQLVAVLFDGDLRYGFAARRFAS